VAFVVAALWLETHLAQNRVKIVRDRAGLFHPFPAGALPERANFVPEQN
jgi:hypothetical protein